MITFHTASFFDKKNHKGICFSIAFSQPSGKKFPELRMFKPNAVTLSMFRAGRIKKDMYERRYVRETLSRTNPKKLLRKIRSMFPANKITDVTLLCWEKAGEFCHRRLVLDWLSRFLKTGAITTPRFKIGEEN